MKTVYLAGPIIGCNYGQANDWRVRVAEKLKVHNIRGVSPLRCEPLIGKKYKLGYDDSRFGTLKAIGAKNAFDVRNCDMTLAYLPVIPSVRHHSYGTIGELAAAHFLNKPPLLVSDDPSIREHPVLNSWAGWVLEDLDQAVDVLVGVLGGYVEGGKYV